MGVNSYFSRFVILQNVVSVYSVGTWIVIIPENASSEHVSISVVPSKKIVSNPLSANAFDPIDSMDNGRISCSSDIAPLNEWLPIVFTLFGIPIYDNREQ